MNVNGISLKQYKKPVNQSLFIEGFIKHVHNNPEKIAIEYQGLKISYGDLNRYSNDLAIIFQRRNLKKGDRLLIVADRKPNLVVAILAAFKLGIIISLTDPKYPVAYIKSCIKVLSPDFCLNLNSRFLLCNIFDVLDNQKTMDLFSLPKINRKSNIDIFENDVFSFDDTAIITFTSGTTGVPKAVAGRYSSLTHFYPWMNEVFGPFESDRFGMCSNVAHDPIQRDIFTPLFFSATIVIPAEEDLFSPGRLPEWLLENKVTICCFTPAMYQFLTTFKDKVYSIENMRLIFFVGESLTLEQVKKIKSVLTKAKIINLYGSTETQRAVSYFVIPDQINSLPEIIPIGYGIGDVDVIVVKEDTLTLCEADEIGEILLRSPYIAKGYLNAPEENERKFVKNPFVDDASDIFYRTGDLGFFDKNSSLGVRCIGRKDQQVKINGHRIELDAINSVVLSHPMISDCTTILANKSDRQQLICYFVSKKTVVFSDLNQYVSSKFPAYMIPSQFIQLDKIPLTENGKINKRKLLEIFNEKNQFNGSDSNHLLTDLEKKVKSILNLPELETDKPLAELGLNSLGVIELFSYIKSNYHIALTFSELGRLNLHEIKSYISQRVNGANENYEIKAKNECRKPSLDILNRFGTVQHISETEIKFKSDRFLHFCSNSYLGLSSDPIIKAAISEFALNTGGSVGAHGSMELNGFTHYHESVINSLNEIYDSESVGLYASAYMANISVIPELVTNKGDIFIDSSCHQSIIDGCLLSGATIHVFRHNDMNSLEDKLKNSRAKERLIVTEGVFSMEGDILNLPDIKLLANQYQALLMVDEACSLGQIGANGFGIESYYQMVGAIDVRVGTLSKSIPASGGYVSTSEAIYNKLRYKHGANFSGAIPMIQAFIASMALERLRKDQSLISALQNNANFWRQGLLRLGFDIGSSVTSIVPVFSKNNAKHLYEFFIQNKLYVFPVFYPWSNDDGKIRTSVTAAHHPELLKHALNLLESYKNDQA